MILIVAAVILAGSLFFPWHYSTEERLMKPTEFPTDGNAVLIGCVYYKMPSVIGYQTPSVLIVVVPLIIFLGACGLLFIVSPNLQGRMVKYGTAFIAVLGSLAILWILYKFDSPDTACIFAFIVAICSIPVSFVTKKQTQQS